MSKHNKTCRVCVHRLLKDKEGKTFKSSWCEEFEKGVKTSKPVCNTRFKERNATVAETEVATDF